MKVVAKVNFKANRMSFKAGQKLSPEQINLLIDILQKLIIGGLLSVSEEPGDEVQPLPLPDDLEPSPEADDAFFGEEGISAPPKKSKNKKKS